MGKRHPFDLKFGEEFLSSLPDSPGVYRIYARDELIYVGKAKSLRKRLSQYRNARRRKKERRMRSIVAEADRIVWEPADSEFDALLVEMRLIQELKPKWNVVGAFTFLYPLIGIKIDGGVTHFCYTTKPDEFTQFKLFGAYRSREITGEAFFSLMRLLKFLGHAMAMPREDRPDFSYQFSFRSLPQEILPMWERFFRGESIEALEDLLMRLLQKAGARAQASEIQEGFKALKAFWKKEADPLARAISANQFEAYPVPQLERDRLFLFYRRKDV